MFIFVLELELTSCSIFPSHPPYCQTSLLYFFIPSVAMLPRSNLVHTTFLVTHTLRRFSQSGIYPVRSVCFLVFSFCFNFRECFSSSIFPIFIKIHLYSIICGFLFFQFLFFFNCPRSFILLHVQNSYFKIFVTFLYFQFHVD